MADVTTETRRWSQGTIPLVLLFCLALAVTLGFYLLLTLRNVLITEKGAAHATRAARIADTLDRVLFERFSDIQVFATNKTLLEGDPSEQAQRLVEYKHLYWYYSWIAVIDATGRLVASTETSASPGNGPGMAADRVGDPNRQEWFTSVRQTGQLYMSDALISPDSGEPAIGFSAPLFGRQGEFRGVVTSRIPLRNLLTILDRDAGFRDRDQAYEWALLNRQGEILSQRDQPNPMAVNLREKNLPSAVRAASAGQPGFLEEREYRRQTPVVTGYTKTHGYEGFPGFGWTVLVWQERDQAYAVANRLLLTVGGIGLLIIAPLTGFAAWASWRLVQERDVLHSTQIELRRSNADLEQFAYVASHDLQEPLRMVASYTQLLGKRYKGRLDADADDFISYAVEGTLRMQQLIQDLLAYSQIMRQSECVAPVDFEAVVTSALANLRSAIGEHQAVVTQDPLPTISGDERLLVQLFQNLLGNAIKFRGEAPPKIHILAQRKETEWMFGVRDNGIGLDPQYAGQIFVLFQRLHTRDDYPGNGIGLTLCKKIVERHGGRIWVDSQLGHGSTFYFTLPGDKTLA